MKKQKWTEKPITCGGYALLCGISSAIVGTIYWAWCCGDLCQPARWVRFKESMTRHFTRKIDEV